MVARLMVEGGIAMHTLFFTACLVDEPHVAVAPLLLVGDPDAPCIVGPGRFPPGRPRVAAGCAVVQAARAAPDISCYRQSRR